MKSNIKTISELTGFSQATVSNVLNNKKNVKKETADLIIQAAQEVGYLASNRLDSVRVVMYKKSGIVLTETPLISALLEGAEYEAQSNNLPLVMCNLKEGEPDFENKMNELLYSRGSGILLLATEMNWEDIRRFEPIKDKVVVVDAMFREGNFDTLLMDNLDSVYNSVSYLYKKGHRSVKMIDSSIDIRNFGYRRIGFMSAMRDYGLSFDQDSFIKLYPTLSGAYRDMKRYLQSAPELPSAFCAINDIIAIGAMKAIQEAGYRIPEDVSIIGFDNMPYGDITSPGLTTVDILKYEMGQKAVQRLIEKCRADDRVQSVTQLQTKIVERQSVKDLNK